MTKSKTEENKGIKMDSKLDIFIDSFGPAMFFLYLFCLGMPFLINFKEVNIFPKILMILGSVLAISATILLWIVGIKEKNKKILLAPIIFSIVFIISFIHYFNFDLWGLRKYEGMLLACSAVFGGLAINGYSVSKFFSRDKLIRVLLVVAFVFAVLGLFLVENPEYQVKNNILFQVSIGLIYLYVLLTLIETYLLGKPKIKINKKYESSYLLLKAIIVIVAIFTLPLYLSWIGLNDDVINKFIQIYASVLGGIITLAGVAWTINNNKEEKKKEDVEKAVPYFTFNIIRNVPENIDGLKICFPDDLELNYDCDTYGEIENSKNSIVILKRLYHDNKWFNLQCNNTLINGGKLILNFKFTNPNDIFLEVSDIFGTLYYYRINVLHTALIGGSGTGVHTIRNIEKIDKKEIN